MPGCMLAGARRSGMGSDRTAVLNSRRVPVREIIRFSGLSRRTFFRAVEVRLPGGAEGARGKER